MPPFSRRSVLKWTLATGVLTFGGAAALAMQKTQLRTPTPKLSTLDPAAYAVLAALADRLCPSLGEGAPGALALGIPAKIDAMLASADSAARTQLVSALMLLENALSGALFGERFVPFTKLDAAQQDAVLADMRDSSIGVRRTLFRALTGLVWPLYWGEPASWQRIRFTGAPSTESLRAMYREQLVDLDSLRATPLERGV